MATKNIVVEGCQLSFQNGGGPPSAISITPGQTSTHVKCGGKAAYKTLKFTISGYTGQAITVTGSGSGSGEIIATSLHTKVEGNKAFLEGDVSASITINGQTTSGTSTVPATAIEIVKVTSAGQTRAKGS